MQIIQQYHVALQQNYAAASACLGALNAASLGNPHTAEDILLAHLMLKPLVKGVVWAWPRILKRNNEFGQLMPWVLLSRLI